MLVQNSVYRNTYLTDGVNKDFYFSFPILEASQVLVQTSAVTDTETVTTVDPGRYTVIGVGQTTGGHISFTTAPPSGLRLALTLNIPITQLYQYAELDSFPAKSHEDALAKLTLICQQLREQISRAVLISTTSEGTSADLINSIFEARDAAQVSATASSTSALAASTSASAASTSASAAEQSAITAAANSAGLITEVQNLSAMYVGKIFAIPATDTYVPNGCAPANGAEYTAAQFPTIYNDYLVGGKLLTCTYAAFASQVALTGNCAKFALDTIAQKFKVPLLKDGDSITQAASTAELGKSYKAALPNLTGDVARGGATGLMFADEVPQGVFKRGSRSFPNIVSGGPGTQYSIGFDAHLGDPIYQDGIHTVLTEQVRLRHFVVLASAQNSASVFDWSNYMAGLASKANNDLSNLTQVGTTAIAHYGVPSTRTINVVLPPSGSTSIPAPSDGWFRINGTSSASGQIISLWGTVYDAKQAVTSGLNTGCYIPVRKNQAVLVSYTMPIASFDFIYSEGAY